MDDTGGSVSRRQSGGLPGALAQQFLTQVEPVLPGVSAKFNGAEREIVGSCHFAGEHTSQDAQGYLEGAVVSGIRAAAEATAAVLG